MRLGQVLLLLSYAEVNPASEKLIGKLDPCTVCWMLSVGELSPWPIPRYSWFTAVELPTLVTCSVLGTHDNLIESFWICTAMADTCQIVFLFIHLNPSMTYEGPALL